MPANSSACGASVFCLPTCWTSFYSDRSNSEANISHSELPSDIDQCGRIECGTQQHQAWNIYSIAKSTSLLLTQSNTNLSSDINLHLKTILNDSNVLFWTFQRFSSLWRYSCASDMSAITSLDFHLHAKNGINILFMDNHSQSLLNANAISNDDAVTNIKESFNILMHYETSSSSLFFKDQGLMFNCDPFRNPIDTLRYCGLILIIFTLVTYYCSHFLLLNLLD